MSKRDLLRIVTGTITRKGPMNTTSFGKASIFIEKDYKQHTNARLRIHKIKQTKVQQTSEIPKFC